jgi:hypothetical protein
MISTNVARISCNSLTAPDLGSRARLGSTIGFVGSQ